MTEVLQPWRAIGLLGLVLALMAFSHTAAKAEVGAEWNVNGSKIGESLTPQFQGSFETEGILLTKIGLSKLELLCPTAKVVNGSLQKSGGLAGKLHFSECITKLNGSTAAACTPKSPGASVGLIETNALKGLLQLHAPGGGSNVPLVELAAIAESKVYVSLELGATCALGNKFDITGKSFLKDTQNEAAVDKVSHLVEEGPLSALFFGANSFTIDGSSKVTLQGAHQGMTFSALPG